MADSRQKFQTVSLPVEITDYINWYKTQVPGVEELSTSSIVKVICQWAIHNKDYLTMCMLSATKDPTARTRRAR